MSSSSSATVLTTCCICLSKMNPPIRTLPCLHSSCASCIDQLITKSKKPFKCPQCRSPFDAPHSSSSSSSSSSASLEANCFTSRLLASAPGGSAFQDDFDQNNIICGICEETEAEEYCKDCQMFFCAGCKRGHRKPKATSYHQFVSIKEGLAIRSGSLSSSSSSSSTSCHKHPQYEVNSFCDKCKEACCPECVVDNHSSHGVVRLSSLFEQFKGEITTLMNKVKNYDHSLSQAIKETTNVLVGLKKQGKLTEEHVHQVFNQLRLQLDEREAELIAEIDQEMHRKEKELVIQKDELEFLLKGIRGAVEFSDRLVRDGNGVEIVVSHKPVVGRFRTLENEVKKTPLIPVTDGVIEFLGGESGLEEIHPQKAIKGIGSIVVKGVISAEKSRVVRNSGNDVILVGQNYSFDLVVVDQKGNLLNGVAQLGAIEVKIDGPLKDVKVDLVELAGDKEGKGGWSGSFKLREIGDHEVSILFRGRHFQGSPFELQVIDQPIYRRDYGLIGENQQPIVRFGSLGSGDGQFNSPRGVACNLKGEIIVVDSGNHRIQVFDKTGRFLFKFGSSGNGNGQFSNAFGVTVDHRNQNQIVVVDGKNHRIQIFDERGGFLRSFGSAGNGDGQFHVPTGITVDKSNGNYLVADKGNENVQIFDSNGKFIRKFGSKGSGHGQFRGPWGIGLLSNGNLVVCDCGNRRVQIFDSTGHFIRVIPGLSAPWYLFIDSDDNILVAEYNGNQVQVFRENGDQVRTIGKVQLSGPMGVCLDDRGRIIVAEYGGHRISIF